MVSRAGEETPGRGRRILITWLVLLGLLIAAFVGTVLLLNLSLYSASGFVGSYLGSLARHDVAAALATPGVVRANDANSELLVPAALADLGGLRLSSDTDEGSGVHRVSYQYDFAGAKGTTTFVVEYTGTRLGFFSTWSFRTSPVSILQVTPQHAAAFTANGLHLMPKGGPGVATAYQVLTPGMFVLGHTSTYLTATSGSVLVKDPSSIVAAEIDIQANKAFVDQLQSELDSVLDQCATQQVLLPTGCPFGQQMANRIEDLPVWSMSAYPKITILPGAEPGTWLVPDTPAAAHLKVQVRSLFDGTLSTFDADVPFTVRYLITFSGDGAPTITLQG